MRTPSPEEIPAITEFADVKLPDARLNRRLEMIAAAAARYPSASLPNMRQDKAALEAAYRFLSNERVEFDAVLQAHLGPDEGARGRGWLCLGDSRHLDLQARGLA